MNNKEKFFLDFYYNYYEIKNNKNVLSIDIDGLVCKFSNLHEDRYLEKPTEKKSGNQNNQNMTSVVSTNITPNVNRLGDTTMLSMTNRDSSTLRDNRDKSLDASSMTHRKLIY